MSGLRGRGNQGVPPLRKAVTQESRSWVKVSMSVDGLRMLIRRHGTRHGRGGGDKGEIDQACLVNESHEESHGASHSPPEATIPCPGAVRAGGPQQWCRRRAA